MFSGGESCNHVASNLILTIYPKYNAQEDAARLSSGTPPQGETIEKVGPGIGGIMVSTGWEGFERPVMVQGTRYLLQVGWTARTGWIKLFEGGATTPKASTTLAPACDGVAKSFDAASAALVHDALQNAYRVDIPVQVEAKSEGVYEVSPCLKSPRAMTFMF